MNCLESFGGRGRDEDSPPTGSPEAVARLRRVGQGNAGPARAVRSCFAHVLALPVTTEIGRVRGAMAINCPNGSPTSASALTWAGIATSGSAPDLTLRAPLPAFHDVPSQSHMGTNTIIHQVDGQWHQTVVHSNTLSYAQRLFPKDVKLSRHGGPVTDLLGGLGASTILRLDVVRDAQLVLNMPTPLKGFGIGQE